MMALVNRMRARARADYLTPDHPVVRCAMELHECYEKRFMTAPADCSSPAFVDAYIRAYAAWHVYSKEES